ncbi:MAG: diguanylate cyclase [Acidobacteria bacterium]|nr:diguanylate cyclase [Acidobacteriota bacterium]
MNSIAVNMMIMPGVVVLVLFLVFTYLYEQSRQPYFRAWQIAWAALTAHYGVQAWAAYQGGASYGNSVLDSLVLTVVAYCIYLSTRLMRERFRMRWQDGAILGVIVPLALWNQSVPLPAQMLDSNFLSRPSWTELALGFLLLYCSFHFYRHAHRRNSFAFTLLAISVALWAVLMSFGEFSDSLPFPRRAPGHLLGPIPQMLMGIAMVMVLFENERNALQENALTFSTLGVDPKRLLSAQELVPNMQNILDKLVAPLPTSRAVILISERWRGILPDVRRGFSEELLQKMDASGAGGYVCELAYRRGGFVAFRNIPEMPEPLPAFPGAGFAQFRQVMAEENITNLTAVSLQTREHNFGVILFPHAERRIFGSSNLRLLIGLALQIGLTLENYAVMHDAKRRTKEYELLTQIGQAISSHLDQDEILAAIHQELGQIFDTSNFYVAFQEGDEIQLELEVEGGRALPKRSCKAANGLTEYVIRTGQPLLIRSEMEKAQERLGVTLPLPQSVKCFCAAPILLGGKSAGVMAVRSLEREYAFELRDLEVLQTAAGQVSVAMENARLFKEEQRRSRHLTFLNNISRIAISREDSEEMLSEMVREIQKTFRFDHIGIGILDYGSKEIEIKAEAGITTEVLGKRIPLGAGILGRVARTGESALVQAVNGVPFQQGVLPASRSVLCIPISYGDSLLGVLNVESREEDAFTPQDRLIMNTLADLLATALHNSNVFQRLQQQSITDSLTGIKTRRFFYESLTSEWKRASRSGRPFSVVLIDLDKFKRVNDGMGHLEGDLVLTRVARLLEQKCRQSNVVARYGGDEFIILMPETGVEQAQALADRLRFWLANDPMLNQHQITGSFGVASFPVHGFSVEDLIKVADAGLYASKHAGGDRVTVAEELEESESNAVQRQLISGYIEGFLHREHTGPERLEELTSTLKKLCGGDNGSTQALREAIESLTYAAESREVNAAGHGDTVARYAEIMARALGMAESEVRDLVFAARVHDVGKIFVPERILNKTNPPTDEEFYLLKMHARAGAEIVATLPASEQMSQAVEYHHEALDGSGYPAGLRGDEIPLWARILNVANVFANLTTEHTFGPLRMPEQALAEMDKLSGVRYDGALVRTLIRELKAEKISAPGD